MRVFCSTGRCTVQAAQLHHAAQREATLRAQLAAVTAERDALAATVGELAGRVEELQADLERAKRPWWRFGR